MATGPSKVKKAAAKPASSHPVYRDNGARKLRATGNNHGSAFTVDGHAAADTAATRTISSSSHSNATARFLRLSVKRLMEVPSRHGQSSPCLG